MNTNQAHATSSGEHLALPEPDPDNITVLTHNLPNNPILPWSHYDSPWREEDEEEDQDETEAGDEVQPSGDEQLTATVEPATGEVLAESDVSGEIEEEFPAQAATDDVEVSDTIDETEEFQAQAAAGDLEASVTSDEAEKEFQAQEATDDLEESDANDEAHEESPMQGVATVELRSQPPIDELRQLG